VIFTARWANDVSGRLLDACDILVAPHVPLAMVVILWIADEDL
jgi:hypothetical protein